MEADNPADDKLESKTENKRKPFFIKNWSTIRPYLGGSRKIREHTVHTSWCGHVVIWFCFWFLHIHFSFQISQDGHRLTISNAVVDNSGVYTCQYNGSGGAVVASDTQVSVSREFVCACMRVVCVRVRVVCVYSRQQYDVNISFVGSNRRTERQKWLACE